MPNHASSFIHERMLEGAGVGIEDGCFQTQFSPGFAPITDSGENFAKDFLRLDGIEPKSRCGGQGGGDAGFLLFLGDGRLAHADTIHSRAYSNETDAPRSAA